MKRSRLLVALAASAAALAIPASANAGALVASAPDCSTQSSSQVFLPFVDPAFYVLAPGGAAESSDGWTLTGNAGIVGGNEPWSVHGSSDGSALSIPAGSSATTGTMCVGIQHPDLRFFSKGSGLGLLNVDVLFETASGDVASAPVGVMTPSGWMPTPVMPIVASLLPLLPGDMTPVQFRFTATGGASFTIDDAYVDPWGGR